MRVQYRQRNVFFYRAHAVDNASQEIAFDGVAFAKAIQTLSWNDRSRYLDVDESHKIACWTIDHGSFPRLAFGYIRPDDDVSIDNQGKLRPALTEAGDGLTEFTYVVFLPHGIVGAIFDSGGPRMKRISEYLVKKCPSIHKSVDFGRLVRKDMAQQLERLGAITQFEVCVHPSQAGLFDDIEDSISAALTQLKRAAEGDTISVVIRAGRKRANTLGSRFRTALKQFLDKPVDRTMVTKLRVMGRDHLSGVALPPIDLLLKQFTFNVKVARPQDNSQIAVDSFRAIEGEYGRHSAQLTIAATLKIDDE